VRKCPAAAIGSNLSGKQLRPAPLTNKSRGRTFHARPDLLGKLVKFDGDQYVVDFIRPDADDRSKQTRK